MKRIAPFVLLLAVNASMAATSPEQSLIVHAISHSREVVDTGTHTSCSGSATSTGPNTATANSGCTSRETAIIYVRNVVEANGIRFTIGCTARWIWSVCPTLTDGDTFPAIIKGHTMIIEVHLGGNQGKLRHQKYRIWDIRGVQ